MSIVPKVRMPPRRLSENIRGLRLSRWSRVRPVRRGGIVLRVRTRKRADTGKQAMWHCADRLNTILVIKNL